MEWFGRVYLQSVCWHVFMTPFRSAATSPEQLLVFKTDKRVQLFFSWVCGQFLEEFITCRHESFSAPARDRL